MNRGQAVRELATELGKDTQHAGVLRRCDSRFELLILDPARLFEEQKTLALVHATLQEETHGILYTGWDKRLSARHD